MRLVDGVGVGLRISAQGISENLTSGSTNFDYDNSYGFQQNRPHQIKQITNAADGITNQFKWDANGNMAQHEMVTQNFNNIRLMRWDEENRMVLGVDNEQMGAYLYDMGGMRTHKAAGTVVVNAQNGQGTRMATINNFCLYPSELITVSNHQYTKHYYQGSKRLASRVGGGFLAANVLGYDPLNDHVALPGTDYQQKAQNLLNLWSRHASGVDMDSNLEWAYEFSVVDQFSNYSAPGEIYFYHPDHLGSSAFITTTNGYATQFMAYQPYGETLLEQQNAAGYYSPYTFSAKEKDEETGYSYFGARYYSAELSVWLGVDPMDHKYPQYSTYHYCGLNPVMVTDPDGADWLEKVDDNGKKIVFWDASVTDASQVDPKSGQKYWGKEGFGIDEATGQGIHYKPDGTIDVANVSAPGITITPESSYATSNPSIGTNNKSGYIYNDRDLKVREGVMKFDNPIKTYLLSQEKQGRFNILNGHDYWLKHGHTNGNLHLMSIYLEMALGLVEPGRIPSVTPFKLKTTGVKGTIPTRQQFFQSQKGNQTGVHKGRGAWFKAMHAEYDKRFK